MLGTNWCWEGVGGRGRGYSGWQNYATMTAAAFSWGSSNYSCRVSFLIIQSAVRSLFSLSVAARTQHGRPIQSILQLLLCAADPSPTGGLPPLQVLTLTPMVIDTSRPQNKTVSISTSMYMTIGALHCSNVTFTPNWGQITSAKLTDIMIDICSAQG